MLSRAAGSVTLVSKQRHLQLHRCALLCGLDCQAACCISHTCRGHGCTATGSCSAGQLLACFVSRPASSRTPSWQGAAGAAAQAAALLQRHAAVSPGQGAGCGGCVASRRGCGSTTARSCLEGLWGLGVQQHTGKGSTSSTCPIHIALMLLHASPSEPAASRHATNY